MDGEEAITLLAALDAGATRSMTSASIVDQIRRVLPFVNHENRQCGFRAAKVLMMERGVIASDACRHPVPPLHPDTRRMAIDLARRLDPVVLRWGR